MNITESIAELDKCKEEAGKMLVAIAKEVEKATDGLLTVCTGARSFDYVQLYHNTDAGTSQQAFEVVKELADDAAITLRWEDEYSICYNFNIDRSPFCIVLEKDDSSEQFMHNKDS